MRIHEHQNWPHFTWDAASLASKLADIRHRQEPFHAAEFPYAFLKAFGNKKTTIDKLKKANSHSGKHGGMMLG